VNYVTSAERLGLARGRKQCRRKGRAEGRMEGLAEAVLVLLNESTGEVEEELRQKITTLTVTELKALLPLAPKFTSKQELLEWLASAERKAAKSEVIE
jgi:predicted transposase YdaD